MFKLESKKLNDTEPPVSHLKLRVGKTSIKFENENNTIDSNIGKFYSVSIGGILGDMVVNNSNVRGFLRFLLVVYYLVNEQWYRNNEIEGGKI